MFLTKTPSTPQAAIYFALRSLKRVGGSKMLLIMKLTAICLLAAVLQVSARGTAQTVTYSAKSQPLVKVLSIIEQQTGYALFYRFEDVKKYRNVSVDLKDADIRTALDKVFNGQPLKYEIEGNTVVISERVEKPSVVRQLNKEKEEKAPPVKGVVRSADGQPLAGVNVVVKGTNKGTTTAANGSFEIDAKEGDRLVISSIGFASKEISISTSQLITVSLAVSNSPLDEVQIIAYGETSKRLQTGNVSSVKAKDIEKQPVQNPLLALQGRVPGIMIEQATGMPGSGVKIRIQGQNSINSGKNPLYVVDGTPIYSDMLPPLSYVLDGTNPGSNSPLSFINPLDIASIEVLKDADATAIYGSRGANGVVLITTKKGKAGAMKVDLNLQKAWGKVNFNNKLKPLGTSEYLEMRKEAFVNDGLPVPDSTSLVKDLFNYDLTVWSPNRQTDWLRTLIGGTAEYENAQGSLSGGSQQTQYMFSGTFHRETTVFPGDFTNKKGSLNLNVRSASTNQKLKFEAGIIYQLDNNKIIGADLTQEAMILAPNAPPLYQADGTLNWEMYNGVSTWRNPLAYLNNKYDVKTSNLILNSSLSYKILPSLDFKIPFSYGSLESTERYAQLLQAKAPDIRPFELNSSSIVSGMSRYWQLEPQIAFKKPLLKGELEFLVGAALYNSSRKASGASGFGFSSDLLIYNLSTATYQFAMPTQSAIYKYNAVFSRINYNLSGKYILNLNARRDGSSRFGLQNQFNNFGSVGGAWIISEENFAKKALPFLSFAKLRASYGSTGNDQIGEYQFLSLWSSPYVPYQGIVGLAPDKLDNYYLQWEETRKFSAGIEIGVLKDRIFLNAGFFRNVSSNQLINSRLPAITGFTGIMQNFAAVVENMGCEFSLTTSNISSNQFSWSSNINLTLLRNKVAKFPDIESTSYASGFGGVIVGEPVNTRKYFDFVGVNPNTGLSEFRTADNKITSNPSFTTDMIVLLNDNFPKFFGGFSNTFTYGGISLDVMFQFVKQTGRIYLTQSRPGEFAGNGYGNTGNQTAYILNRWQQPGDHALYQRYSATYPVDVANAFAAFNSSDAYYADASFIRLKNLSLSYQLPSKWLSRTGLQNTRLFLQAQNLATITNYKGLDPETKSSTTLPPLRMLSIGVQVTL